MADIAVTDIEGGGGGIGSGSGLVTTRLQRVGGREPPAKVRLCQSTAALASDLGLYVRSTARASIEDHGSFTLVLSGGSLVKALSDVASSGSDEPAPDWSRWHVFWADERVVPLGHPDSNYGAAAAEFLGKVPIPHSNVHAISEGLDAIAAADDYEATLRQLVGSKVLMWRQDSHGTSLPQFDLLLLGVGPDGHIASLFPHHPLMLSAHHKVEDEETAADQEHQQQQQQQKSWQGQWVAAILDSPKPPPHRITLTLPVVNAAAHVVFVATGAGKKEILRRVFASSCEGKGALPAQEVLSEGRELIWYLDAEAAAAL